MEKVIVSKKYDLLLLCFPLWVPVLFYVLFTFLSSISATIFLLALFLLAETHFGATWFFFMDPTNREYMKTKQNRFLFFPMIVIGVTLFTFFVISPGAALVLASAASAFHVTRQSIGVNKIFGIREHPCQKISNIAIYVMSAFFILVGAVRFFLNISLSTKEMILIQGIGILGCIAFFLLVFVREDSKDLPFTYHLTTFTGMIIYVPYLFVSRPEIATTMGVGMHWLQYLAITMPLYLRKSERFRTEKKTNGMTIIVGNKILMLVYLLLYAGLMVILRQWGLGFKTFEYSAFIIIPITLQMLHFYYDSLIWRFSDSHIRKEVGSYIFIKKEGKTY